MFWGVSLSDVLLKWIIDIIPIELYLFSIYK